MIGSGCRMHGASPPPRKSQNEFSGSRNPQKTRAGKIPMTKTIMMKMRILSRMIMRITWTTLTTTKRERGRETMMRKREKTVRRREHTPGPSSQAEQRAPMKKLC